MILELWMYTLPSYTYMHDVHTVIDSETCCYLPEAKEAFALPPPAAVDAALSLPSGSALPEASPALWRAEAARALTIAPLLLLPMLPTRPRRNRADCSGPFCCETEFSVSPGSTTRSDSPKSVEAFEPRPRLPGKAALGAQLPPWWKRSSHSPKFLRSGRALELIVEREEVSLSILVLSLSRSREAVATTPVTPETEESFSSLLLASVRRSCCTSG